MIKNLVIGSEGFVGATLCKFLEKKGEKVTRFDIKRDEKEDARTALFHFENFDRVYFLAWEVGGAKYLYQKNTQIHQLDWNVDLLRNVMSQLQKAKTPFLFTSSQLAVETDTIYGATKKLGELWTEQIGGACVRLWNIYGALEKMTVRSHVVGDFVYQAITTGEVRMMTTGEEKRQFIHVLDACEGFHHIMNDNLTGAIYDLTSFEWSTIREVANLIGRYADAKVIPGKHGGSFRSAAALEGKPPDWVAKISLDEGIKMMVKEALRKKDNFYKTKD